MLSILLVPILIIGGLDAGARVGGVFPVAGLGVAHASGAQFGAALGYSAGRSRFELGYDYAALPGPQSSPYQMSIHEVTLGYGYEFVRRQSWCGEATGGAGYSLLQRSLQAASETGKAPFAKLGVGLNQRQGKTRLSLGLGNTLYPGLLRSGSRNRFLLVWLFSIRAGVAYVF
jgi:hypothetical protein